MMPFLAVFVGGGFGAATRYGLCRSISNAVTTGFPAGTMVINLTGCFIIGLLFGLFERYPVSSSFRLLLMTGFLGGYTTFSSFGLEAVSLIKNREFGQALFYVLGSNLIGLLLAVSGMLLAGLVFRNSILK